MIKRVSRTGSVDHLSVPLQNKVGYQSATTDGTGRQPLSHQPHGMLGGQTVAVVSNEGDAVTHGVVSQSVGPLPVPAATHVDVAVRACDKASGEDGRM